MKNFDYLLTSQSIVSLKYNDTLCSILYKWRYFFFFIKNKTKVAWFLDFPLYEKKVTWVQRKDQKTRNKNFMKKVTVIHWYLENSNFSVGILKIERFLYSRKRIVKQRCNAFYYQNLIPFRDLDTENLNCFQQFAIHSTNTISNFEVSNINRAMPTTI